MKRFKVISLAIILAVLLHGCDSEEFASAKMWVQSNDLEKAEEFFIKAQEVEPENAEVSLLLGTTVYLPQKRWKEMNDAFDEAVRRNPDQVTSDGPTITNAVNMARQITWSQEYQKGALLYNEVLAETGGEVPNEERRAKLLKVAEHFHTAIMISPGEESTYEPLVFTYIQLQDDEGRDAAIELALKNSPDNATIHALAGQKAREDGHLEEAIKHLEKASGLTSDNLDILTVLTGIYLDMDDSESALKILEKARKSAPQSAEVFFNIGAIYINVANTELTKGQDMYKAAVNEDMASRATMVKQALAHFAEAQSGYSEGLYFMDNVLAINPDDTSASQAISDIRNRKKMLDTLERATEGLLD